MNSTSRLALLLGAALLAAPAVAADYDPPIVAEEPVEYVPVEVGSGWYLRGDIAYNFNQDYRDTAIVNTGVFPALGPFATLTATAHDERETPIFASGGFGYHFNDYLRADVNLGIVPRSDSGVTAVMADGCSGTETVSVTPLDGAGNPSGPPVVTTGTSTRDCAAGVDASNHSWTGTVNGYVDLGTIAGITPYVGAGAGLIYTRNEFGASASCLGTSETSTDATSETTTVFVCDSSEPVASYDHSDYTFLYSLSAGFAYQMTRNAALDVGYQYMSAPDMQHWTVTQNGPEISEGVDYHQVKVGLRYELW